MTKDSFEEPAFTLRTSREWYEYYEANAQSLLEIPWDGGADLTADEEHEIGASLQAWQLGETSDGAHLTAAAERYAREKNDPDFLKAVRMFILEEQRHGRYMGAFLDRAGIARLSRNWGDSLFRAVRYALPNMEIWVSVVIMVEIIALTYFQALHDATGSPLLRRICQQILRDEVEHIRFQYERLAILYQGRGSLLMGLIRTFHRVFFCGTALAVWAGHHRAFQAGGYPFVRYWREVWVNMNRAWQRTDPGLYAWHSERGAGVGARPGPSVRALS